VWLRTATELAGDDPLELSRIRSVMGIALVDVESHDQAREALRSAIDLAVGEGDRRQEAWAGTFLGRSYLLCNELDAAEETLRRAGELIRAERWTAFLPLPEALLAEVWVRQGLVDLAAETFEHAFALGCSVNDACWEAYGVRGLGLLQAADGDLDASIASMEEATTRCARQRDTHLWLRAYVLDALCAVAVAAKHPQAGAWTSDLASVGGRTGMRRFSVRAYLYQRDLGDASAIDGARALAVGIENPHLLSLIEPDGPYLLDDLLGRGISAEVSRA
jgi:tetratricopeptide (TPR) repeat protein